MRGWEDWKLLVAVPATVGVCTLLVLIFKADADHAAQFFGAFLAAIVAAGAVVLTTYLQADLKRKQDLEARKTDILAIATDTYCWMEILALRLQTSADLIMESVNRNTTLTVGDVRGFMPSKLQEDLRARLRDAARIPQPMGHQVVAILHAADSTLDFVAYMPTLQAGTQMPVPEMKRRGESASRRAGQLRYTKATLGQYLVEQDFLIGLDHNDRAALSAGFLTTLDSLSEWMTKIRRSTKSRERSVRGFCQACVLPEAVPAAFYLDQCLGSVAPMSARTFHTPFSRTQTVM